MSGGQLGLLDEVAGYVPATVEATARPSGLTVARVGFAVREWRVGACNVCRRGFRLTLWRAPWSELVDADETRSRFGAPFNRGTRSFMDDGTGRGMVSPPAMFLGVRCCGELWRGRPVEGRYNPGRECNAACMGARGPSCECQCAGANHGGGWAL